ncbi:Uncharacterised protein [Mycobacteroides abscessus]|nr:Uncharacterised protein [Mycobacteroides abscessus]
MALPLPLVRRSDPNGGNGPPPAAGTAEGPGTTGATGTGCAPALLGATAAGGPPAPGTAPGAPRGVGDIGGRTPSAGANGRTTAGAAGAEAADVNPFAKSCTGPPGAADGTAPRRGTDEPFPKPPNEFDGFMPDDKPPSIDDPLPEPALGLIPPANGEAGIPRPAPNPHQDRRHPGSRRLPYVLPMIRASNRRLGFDRSVRRTRLETWSDGRFSRSRFLKLVHGHCLPRMEETSVCDRAGLRHLFLLPSRPGGLHSRREVQVRQTRSDRPLRQSIQALPPPRLRSQRWLWPPLHRPLDQRPGLSF